MSNPFKDINDLQNDVEGFLRKHRSTLFRHAKRISDYFEMACFNYLVKYYEGLGYTTTPTNLKKQKFRYKCSTQGDPNNFSYFTIEKNDDKFEIHHNINISSAHGEGIFTTPDMSVVLPNSTKEYENFYNSSTKYYYCPNDSLITFFESKNFNPFPELQFSFIGVVNELKPSCLSKQRIITSDHIAPSLLMSGKANDHNMRIGESLQDRYDINIISDLFSVGNAKFGKYSIAKYRRIAFQKTVIVNVERAQFLLDGQVSLM